MAGFALAVSFRPGPRMLVEAISKLIRPLFWQFACSPRCAGRQPRKKASHPRGVSENVTAQVISLEGALTGHG